MNSMDKKFTLSVDVYPVSIPPPRDGWYSACVELLGNLVWLDAEYNDFADTWSTSLYGSDIPEEVRPKYWCFGLPFPPTDGCNCNRSVPE